MGTETKKNAEAEARAERLEVKLNNPLMGTETIV